MILGSIAGQIMNKYFVKTNKRKNHKHNDDIIYLVVLKALLTSLIVTSSSIEARMRYSWVETAISVFAFLNIVVVSISFLILLGFMFMSFIECMTLTVDNRIIALSAAIGINVGVLIVFGFAVLLYLGIYQKKPALVLAYFIFGVVIDAALVSGLLAVHYGVLDVDMSETVREIYGFWREPVTHAVIVIFLVYTVVLAMTFRTWSLMTSRRSEDHRKLANYFPEPDME